MQGVPSIVLDNVLKNLPALVTAVFVAILFLQSGLDKVVDWKGNLAWLSGHFSKTFLAPFVPMMVATITIAEILTGLMSVAGIVYYLASGSLALMFASGAVGALTLTALFFGQRVAKDYPGAAVLVPYFLLQIVLMVLSNPYAKN